MKTDKEFYTVRGYQRLHSENRSLTSSMEDYLEMIYRTCLEEGYARINQLATSLNVRPSSATKVVQRLGELNLVEYKPYGMIHLTEEGILLGEFLLKRHEIIQEFLLNLGIEKTILKETELIEHDVSPSTLHAIDTWNKFLTLNPEIKKRFDDYKLKSNNTLFMFEE